MNWLDILIVISILILSSVFTFGIAFRVGYKEGYQKCKALYQVGQGVARIEFK